jgi:hypothetical protein
MPKWYFPPLWGGERKGINDGGIVQFSRKKALARETTQNMGDNPDGSGNPVIATFELVKIPTSSFPGREKLFSIFEQCAKHVKSGTANEASFFQNGLNILEEPTISFLKISDENTTGLTGTDSDDTKSFYKLVRLSGSSSEQGNVGGTYGIGQRAPFAHSPLRTIFYSSNTKEGKVFVGKSILATFPDPTTNEANQNIGWWCNPIHEGRDWEACRNESEIPIEFQREQIGTDIWVSGYQEDTWDETIRHSILEHFFAAIQNKQLIVQIKNDGLIASRIDHSNLEEEISKAADENSINCSRSEHMKGLGATLYFHKALTTPINGKPFEAIIPHIGKVEFFVYRDAKNKDMPNRWATMRSPRIIVQHFGSGLLNGFAGVLICDNESGNKYLAQLEDATHEKWSEEQTRNWSKEQKQEAKKVLNEINRFVRETLKEIRGMDLNAQEDVPFLGNYLPTNQEDDEEQQEGDILPSSEQVDIETGTKVTKPFNDIISSKTIKQIPAIARVEDINRSKKKKKKKKKKGLFGGVRPVIGVGGSGEFRDIRVKGEGESAKILSTNNVHFRSFRSNGEYKLVLKSDKAIKGELTLSAVGEDNSYSINVKSAKDDHSGEILDISGAKILGISLEPNVKKVIDVALDGPEELCLTIGG